MVRRFLLIPLMVVLVSGVFFGGCASEVIVEVEKEFTVLDPRSYEPEVEYQGLTPRLDTLEGKTVGIVNMGGSGAQMMDTMEADLEAAIPGCNAEYLEGRATDEFLESCDAIIIGHNY